jgi:hypothetical protein
MRQPVLRPAHPRDFPFCERLYFAEMNHIITQLGFDMARQRESFARQWHVAEVRIITMSGEDIGCLQTKTVRLHSLQRSNRGYSGRTAGRVPRD